MAEPKPFASLTSGLLARKGGAAPAMRRQFSYSQDDLGWNDMGHDVPERSEPRTATGLTPMGSVSVAAPVVDLPEPAAPVVVEQQRMLEQKIAPPVPKAKATKSPIETQIVPNVQLARTKAAFTLRLDADRHLRLRLASAVGNRSAQQIVTEALDRLLESVPGLDALADKARKDSSKD